MDFCLEPFSCRLAPLLGPFRAERFACGGAPPAAPASSLDLKQSRQIPIKPPMSEVAPSLQNPKQIMSVVKLHFRTQLHLTSEKLIFRLWAGFLFNTHSQTLSRSSDQNPSWFASVSPCLHVALMLLNLFTGCGFKNYRFFVSDQTGRQSNGSEKLQ